MLSRAKRCESTGKRLHFLEQPRRLTLGDSRPLSSPARRYIVTTGPPMSAGAWVFDADGVTVDAVGSGGVLAGRAGRPEAVNMSTPECARRATGRSPMTIARRGWGDRFFARRRRTRSKITRETTRFYHALSDTHYSMIRRGGEFYQRRWQIGFGGAEINVEELKVDYILGSGNHARSYLHRTAAGTLIELPLGWYPDPKSGRSGRCRRVPIPIIRGRAVSSRTSACLAITGFREFPTANEAPGSDPVFLGDLPEGIDCQRCHGPGGKHVRTAGAAGAKVEEIRGEHRESRPPEFQTRDGSLYAVPSGDDERTDSRGDTALQPRSVFFPSRASRSKIPQYFSIMRPGTGHDEKFEAVSSVYRLRQSRCFAESEGRLTCQTCHNPHRVPRGEEAIAALFRRLPAVAMRRGRAPSPRSIR